MVRSNSCRQLVHNVNGLLPNQFWQIINLQSSLTGNISFLDILRYIITLERNKLPWFIYFFICYSQQYNQTFILDCSAFYFPVCLILWMLLTTDNIPRPMLVLCHYLMKLLHNCTVILHPISLSYRELACHRLYSQM